VLAVILRASTGVVTVGIIIVMTATPRGVISATVRAVCAVVVVRVIWCSVVGIAVSTDPPSFAPALGTKVRGQSPSSMGESFFFSCTRHVSMYLRRGIVIHSFCPTGYYFLLVSLGITQDLLTHVCYRNVLSR
jgi:hypothetical protein